MNIEDAICTLNALKKEALDDYESYPRRAWALDMAIAALREQEERRWIPVTERMPEKGGTYLCVWQGKKTDTGFFSNGHFRLYGEIKDNLITCWMPMPEPPKEDAK